MMDTGAVGTALLREGGEELQQAALEKGPIALGEVVVTGGYGLDAEYVLHAAAAHFGGDSSQRTIATATKNVLRTADSLSCASVVLPAIGCGIAGFPFAQGVEVIHTQITEYSPSSIEEIRLIGYTDEEYQVMREIFG
jgi:O-acetyl-ADP-ribose deacetylase (regulator of RNase III)